MLKALGLNWHNLHSLAVETVSVSFFNNNMLDKALSHFSNVCFAPYFKSYMLTCNISLGAGVMCTIGVPL